MTPTQQARLMTLFDQACGLPRVAVPLFLETLEAADAPLLPSLRELLHLERHTQVFFDRVHGGPAPTTRDLEERGGAAQAEQPDPTQVGEYEILERLGAGGMGSVYKARQHSPDRVVALKMLHPWLVSADALERFRFEAQALASLKHPSIPPIFAVGQQEGRVYFAMELVNGPNLTAWVEARAASVPARVELLAKVCDAVHHAHLRGFVHRDLKPDNIRVTDEGTPQVLDFGISAGLGERAEVAGTPAYMSPEQLEPGALVDVRSDVFSLGIIAFEVLAGELPLAPPRGSFARLRALKLTPTPRLPLGGELASIVARALEIAPERRYASAAELGEDLRRHLAHRSVAAHAGGVGYRLGRFVRRNRLGVAAVSGIILLLAVAALVSRAQYLKAERARAAAAVDAERAKASLGFLSTVLQGADAAAAAGERGATIGQALDRAAAKLASAHLDPHVEAAVRASLANTYVGIGEWKSAEEQARLALAAYETHHLEADEDLAEVERLITQVHEEVGDTANAVLAARRALALEERFHGTAPHTHLSNSLHVAAIALRDAGELEEALALHRRALDAERVLSSRSGDTGDLSDMLDQYGMTLVTIGRYEEAEAAHREALALKLARYGPLHQHVATSYHHLGKLELEQEHFEAARALFTRSIALRLATLGKDHVRLALARSLLARAELGLGHVDAAAEQARETIRIAEHSYGVQFGRYARLSSVQVLVWLAQGRPEEALKLSQQLLELTAARFGPGHYATAEARSNHALALLTVGRKAEAIAELEDVVAVVTRVLGERPRVSREARARLAQARALP
jgi:tetratricopeptide (TPR) repeat protein